MKDLKVIVCNYTIREVIPVRMDLTGSCVSFFLLFQLYYMVPFLVNVEFNRSQVTTIIGRKKAKLWRTDWCHLLVLF